MAQGKPGRGLRRAALVAATLAVVYGAQWLTGVDLSGLLGDPPELPPRSAPQPGPSAPPAPPARDDTRLIGDLFREQRSGVMVESAGRVERLLPDDEEGSRHQRFVLRLHGGHTLLVAHNIDLAPRLPVGEGDIVRFRGQYEWNERGGVLHWTHRDPDGDRPGGWLELAGKRYR